jgi:excisionase family DNA binding protein
MSTPAPTPVKVLNTRQAAAYLGISLPTLFRLVRAGELAHLRIGRTLRFRLEDLESFLAARVTTEWRDFNPDRKKTGEKE